MKMQRGIVFLAVVGILVGCGGVSEEVSASEGDEARMMAVISGDERFQQVRAQLARHGDELAMEQASFHSMEDGFAAVIPLKGEESEYSALVYQQLAGQQPLVSLELSGRPSKDTQERSAFECGAWGNWYTLYPYCGGHPYCIQNSFAATMLVRERCRTCGTSSVSRRECENTTVLNRCGC
jgi:hypothetical protein